MRFSIWGSALAVAMAWGCTEPPSRIEIVGPGTSRTTELGSIEPTDRRSPELGGSELPVLERRGETLKLRALAFDAEGRFLREAAVRWQSVDPSVATVDASGVLTAQSSGQTQVVAVLDKSDPPRRASIDVRALIIGDIKIVRPQPVGGRSLTLPMGRYLRFEAEVRNDQGRVVREADVRWESTTWAATIGMNGEAEGRALGRTHIIARTANGVSDKVELHITDWAKKSLRHPY